MPFAQWSKAISVEGAYAYFSPDRLGNGNAWNVGARFSVLPFGSRHFRLLNGSLDGALEAGLEPLFARFEGTHQNFGGVLLDLRYDLTHFSIGPFAPLDSRVDWTRRLRSEYRQGQRRNPTYPPFSAAKSAVHTSSTITRPFTWLCRASISQMPD